MVLYYNYYEEAEIIIHTFMLLLMRRNEEPFLLITALFKFRSNQMVVNHDATYLNMA